MSAESTVERRAVRSVLWAFATTGAGRLITLASLIVLARLLSPAEFGVVAFALVFIAYVETVGDLGTGMALIYWRERRDDAAQVTFLLNVVMAVLWTAVSIALAPLVAEFFQHPAGAPYLYVLSASFLIKGLGNTHDALCRKDLRFRARLLPETGFATIKGVVALALAFAGFGAWSLVWGQLAGLTARVALLWRVVPWRPGLRVPRDLVAPMLRYGRGIIAVNMLAAVVHHIDLVIIGHALGPVPLGLYQMAAKLPEMTITTVVWVTGKVLFPAFSKLQGSSGRFASAYLGALRYISMATLPAAVALAILASPIVVTLFGDQWVEAVPILRALAIYASLRSLGSHAGDVLKASGRPGLLAALGVLKAALLVPALLLAVGHGALAVAVTLVAVTAVTMSLNLGVAVSLLSISSDDLARAVMPGIALAAAVGLVVGAWSQVGGLPPWLQLTVGAGLAAVAYGATLRLGFPEIEADVRRSLRPSEAMP